MKYRLRQIPALLFTLALAAGILLQQYLHPPILFIYAISIFLIILAVLLKKQRIYLLVVIFIITGALNFRIWYDHNLNHPVMDYLPVEHVDVISRIIDPPPKDKYNFIIRVEKIVFDGDTVNIGRKFQALVRNEFDYPFPGDRLIFKNVRLDQLPQLRNPGQFDYAAFLKMRGVMAAVTRTPESVVKFEKSDGDFSFGRFFFKMRKNISARLSKYLDDQPAQFLIAILLGEKEGLSPEIKTDFQNSGVAHVLFFFLELT
ncbi:MAG: ComEC family competence protein [Calditrichia bacterium]